MFQILNQKTFNTFCPSCPIFDVWFNCLSDRYRVSIQLWWKWYSSKVNRFLRFRLKSLRDTVSADFKRIVLVISNRRRPPCRYRGWRSAVHFWCANSEDCIIDLCLFLDIIYTYFARYRVRGGEKHEATLKAFDWERRTTRRGEEQIEEKGWWESELVVSERGRDREREKKLK